jgi:hypothetical protein
MYPNKLDPSTTLTNLIVIMQSDIADKLAEMEMKSGTTVHLAVGTGNMHLVYCYSVLTFYLGVKPGSIGGFYDTTTL